MSNKKIVFENKEWPMVALYLGNFRCQELRKLFGDEILHDLNIVFARYQYEQHKRFIAAHEFVSDLF